MRVWLGRLLMILLSVALTASVGAWVLNQTVWNSAYLEHKIESTKLPDALAAQIPSALAANTSTPSDAKTVLEAAVTPAYVRSQLETLIELLEKYYRQGGVPPKLDLSDLSNRIEAAGLPVPPGLTGTIETPLAVGSPQLNQTLSAASRGTGALQWLAPLAALVLAALIFVLAGERRWLVLAEGAVGGAIGTLIVAGLALAPPGLIASALSTSPAKLLAPPLQQFAQAVGNDQATRLLVAAVILAAAALLLGLIHLLAKMFGRIHRHRD